MPKKRKDSFVQLRGKVRAFNISPKGHAEGVVVETEDGTVQINFPKHEFATLAASMKIGGRIDLKAELETDDGEHPVYSTSDGEVEITGEIVRLNYSLHGEINGCHLDDGTFVHTKPDGAKKHKLVVGDRVRATGRKRAGTDAAVVEVRELKKVD